MHKTAPEIQEHIRIPFAAHIADATADAIKRRGIERIGLLGCTEIGLIVAQNDCSTPLFDTTEIHAEAAVAYALA